MFALTFFSNPIKIYALTFFLNLIKLDKIIFIFDFSSLASSWLLNILVSVFTAYEFDLIDWHYLRFFKVDFCLGYDLFLFTFFKMNLMMLGCDS